MKTKCLLPILLSILATLNTFAYDSLHLKFVRGNSMDNSLVVITDGNGNTVDGITASISCGGASSWLTANAAADSGILCPQINTNATSSSQPITYTIVINGLDTAFSFDSITVINKALNSQGAFQGAYDGKNRFCNFSVECGETSETLSAFASLVDIDIKQPDGNDNAVAFTANEACNATKGALCIKITIYKGSDNQGCFYGLTEIDIDTRDAINDNNGEEGDSIEQERCYTFTSYNGAMYMLESKTGELTHGNFSNDEKCFWRLVPAESGEENVYYIQNAVSGKYIQSSRTPGTSQPVSMGNTPVEYYVGANDAVGNGYYYMCSTDNPSYATVSASNLALNKGANGVVAYASATANKNSYWKIEECEFTYEVIPFEAQNATGNIQSSYYIEGRCGKNITLAENGITLETPDIYDPMQEWHFAGSNNRSGWIIASSANPQKTIGTNEDGTVSISTDSLRWILRNSTTAIGYHHFVLAGNPNDTLRIEGETLFKFSKARNSYAKSMQIYNNPCGYLSGNYIKEFCIDGEDVIDGISYESTNAPTSWHILYTHDKGIVSKGKEFHITATLADTPNKYLSVTAHFDWNCDGVFDTEHEIATDGKECHATISVPANATEKHSRMRIRVNENSLDLPDDDIEGVAYDFIITAIQPRDTRCITTGCNDNHRGNATLSADGDTFPIGTTLTATATPNGNSNFICWRNGMQIVSTEAEYTFTVSCDMSLIAYFSPDTDGIDDITAVTTPLIQTAITIRQTSDGITSLCDSEIMRMAIYRPDASPARVTHGSYISTTGMHPGIYILQVTAANAKKNFKIRIR